MDLCLHITCQILSLDEWHTHKNLLFIMVIEYLTKMTTMLVEDGPWNIDNAMALTNLLNWFELASGLRINLSKSKLY